MDLSAQFDALAGPVDSWTNTSSETNLPAGAKVRAARATMWSTTRANAPRARKTTAGRGIVTSAGGERSPCAEDDRWETAAGGAEPHWDRSAHVDRRGTERENVTAG